MLCIDYVLFLNVQTASIISRKYYEEKYIKRQLCIYFISGRPVTSCKFWCYITEQSTQFSYWFGNKTQFNHKKSKSSSHDIIPPIWISQSSKLSIKSGCNFYSVSENMTMLVSQRQLLSNLVSTLNRMTEWLVKLVH